MPTKSNVLQKLFTAATALLIVFGTPLSLTAQGGRIAFTAPVTVKVQRGSATYNQIFTMNPDGSGLQQLTTALASSSIPRWSPGQQYLAFIRGANLMVMRADGVGAFTVAPGASAAGSVDWSPDGSQLLFTGAGDHIYVVAVDPLAQTAGTPSLFLAGPSYDPSWSADGSKIAFDRYPCDCQASSSIIIHDIASGVELDFSQIVAGAGISNAWGPKWSPDGTKLLFRGAITVTVATRKGTSTSVKNEAFIANADGSNIIQVTPSTIQVVSSPAWAPDGNSIAFASNINGVAIYSMLIGSSTYTFLSNGTQPDWAP